MGEVISFMEAVHKHGAWGLLALAIVGLLLMWRHMNKEIKDAQGKTEAAQAEAKAEREKHYAWAVEQVAKSAQRESQTADALELQAKNTCGILEILLKEPPPGSRGVG